MEGDCTYIVWKAETADHVYEIGTDTFVVQGGKIIYQTFCGQIVPKGWGELGFCLPLVVPVFGKRKLSDFFAEVAHRG